MVLLLAASAQVQGLQLELRIRAALGGTFHSQVHTMKSLGGMIILLMATNMQAILANTENLPVAHLILLKVLTRLIPLIV